MPDHFVGRTDRSPKGISYRMSATNTKSMPLFGFISIVDLGDATWIGGYLLLNSLGRPVEFHCSEPVKANRAQQILYGETLPAFVCSEQIGRALVDNSQLKPTLIMTDQEAALALRELTGIPVAWLAAEVPSNVRAGLVSVTLGDSVAFIEEQNANDQLPLQEALEQVMSKWDLQEPFERIREAVSELQKAA